MLGAVLAGGRSRRFGRDKIAVEVEGVPMALRAVRALAPSCAEVVIVTSRPTPAEWGTVIPDLRPGLGPLAGIESALGYAAERGYPAVFVLAADLPRVGPEVVAEVARAMAGGPAPAPLDRSPVQLAGIPAPLAGSPAPLAGSPAPLAVAAARCGDPDFEPLCAVYRTECLEVVSSLLDRGARAARTLVESVGGRKVELDDEAAAAVSVNVNVPDDLDRIS